MIKYRQKIAIMAAAALLIFAVIILQLVLRGAFSEPEAGGRSHEASSASRPSEIVRKDSSAKPALPKRVSSGKAIQDVDLKAGWTIAKYEYLFDQTHRFLTVDEKGELTDEAVENAGLSQLEASKCREIFIQHRNQMRELIAANVVPDYSKPEDKAITQMFFIKAFPAIGSETFESLLQSLDKEIGEHKRNLLIAGYSVRGATSYGNLNAHVKIYNDDDKVRVEFFDARNANQTGMSEMPLETFRNVYGAVDTGLKQ